MRVLVCEASKSDTSRTALHAVTVTWRHLRQVVGRDKTQATCYWGKTCCRIHCYDINLLSDNITVTKNRAEFVLQVSKETGLD
jgi:hypothetical protein